MSDEDDVGSLIVAMREGKECAEIIRQLVANGVNIKESSQLFHFAVQVCHFEACKVLIENGADVDARNTRNETPLYCACDWVLDRKKRPKRDKIVKLLLESGADVTLKTPARCDHVPITAFHRAVDYGQTSVVQIFLNFGVDVDLHAEDDSTPLHWASQADIVEILCESKADVNARRKDGQTPLHVAVWGPSANVVKTLLKFGADIDARGPNNQPALVRIFHKSDSLWFDEMVTTVLDEGCDVNVVTDDGKTALDVAVSKCEASYGMGSGKSYREAVKILTMHLIKLKVAGLYVSEKNLGLLDGLKDVRGLEDFFTDKLPRFQQSCEEELDRMKKEAINPPYTLFSVLASGNNPSYARNGPLMEVLSAFSLDPFPIYSNLLLANFRKSKPRLELVGLGQKWFDCLLRTSGKLNGQKCSILPFELLEKIVVQLSNFELKCLIACGKALKQQVNKRAA